MKTISPRSECKTVLERAEEPKKLALHLGTEKMDVNALHEMRKSFA